MKHPLGVPMPPGTTAVHVAEEIGISVYTLKSWIRRGVIPGPEGSRGHPVWYSGHVAMGRDIRQAIERGGLDWARELTARMNGGQD